MVCRPNITEYKTLSNRALGAEAINFYQFQKFNSMKTLSLTTLLTTLFVALGAALFAQNQAFSLDAQIVASGIEIQDLENPRINYTYAEYDKVDRQVRYQGYIGDEILYESGTGEELVPLNTFTLTLEDHPHKNAVTVQVETAKGYKAILEARDYSEGFLGYKLFLDGEKVGEGQARLEESPERVRIISEYGELIDGHDALNILRFSPVEIAAISPFTLFAEQPSWSNGYAELASAIQSMDSKFEKWLGGERGLRLAPDSQNFSSVSGVCTVASADNPEQDCRYTEEEHDEQNAFLHISVAE
jgi:hypothetical protein